MKIQFLKEILYFSKYQNFSGGNFIDAEYTKLRSKSRMTIAVDETTPLCAVCTVTVTLSWGSTMNRASYSGSRGRI